MRNLNREQWRSLGALLDQASAARDRRGLRYRLPTGLTLLLAGGRARRQAGVFALPDNC